MKVRGQGDAKPAAHEREGDRRKVSKVGRGLQCLRDNEKKQKKREEVVVGVEEGNEIE